MEFSDDAGVALRPVSDDDGEFLLKVYGSSRADEMALVDWSDEQKWAFLRMQSDAQRQQYFARFPDAEYSVILLAGAPAGRLWVARTPEQIRLLDIAILPEYQNRGVGGLLLRQLIAESEEAGLPLRHMVFKMNEGAQRFYERLGFKHIEDVGAYLHMERLPASRQTSTPAGD